MAEKKTRFEQVQLVPTQKNKNDKYGLVLGGGGAKGCYHVGVWQALNEEKIFFDGVAGTSIGALVGIFYPGNNIQPVTDFVIDMQPGNVATDLPILPVTLKEKILGSRTILQFMIKYFESRMDITPLRTRFRQMFNYDSFKNSPIKYACMTFNDTKKEIRPFFKGEINADNAEEIVMASSACYPAFPKVTFQGEEYMDGMYADNVPISLLEAILPEATWTLVVDLHDPGEAIPPALKDDMFYIQPLLQLGHPLDFSPTHAKHLYAQGYLEAKKYMGKYPGYLYTFREDDQPLIEIVEKYLTAQLAQMKVVFPKVAQDPNFLYRALLGYYPAILPNGKLEDYELGRLVEGLALFAKVDPIALYDYRQFLEMVVENLATLKLTQSTPEEFALVGVLGRVRRDEIPNLLFKMLKQNGGHFSERIESMKERIPTSYTLAIIRYCLELLLEQLDPNPKLDDKKEIGTPKETLEKDTEVEIFEPIQKETKSKSISLKKHKRYFGKRIKETKKEVEREETKVTVRFPFVMAPDNSPSFPALPSDSLEKEETK